jgi:hypothetical protein
MKSYARVAGNLLPVSRLTVINDTDDEEKGVKMLYLLTLTYN